MLSATCHVWPTGCDNRAGTSLMSEDTLSQALRLLKHLTLTPTELILHLLTSPLQSHQAAKSDSLNNTTHIFDAFSCMPLATTAVHSWVHTRAKNLYMQQVCALTNPECGFQCNARNATAEKIQSFLWQA